MRTAYNCSNVNLVEKREEIKSGNFKIIVRRGSKNRPCLRCGKKFLSEGPYNRICAKCNLINEKIRAARYPIIFSFTELTDNVERSF
ncbi:MAG: hypothetical protein ACYSTS_18185 [Planctomycetota bacterium]